MATSKKAALALSLAAVCGTIAFFSIPSTINSDSVSVIESLPPISISASLPSSLTTQLQQSPLRHRRLSTSLPDGGCEISWPKQPSPGIEITYAASYPGCGARMTWNLVEALTGLWTGDDWNNNGRGEDVVTVKTHYPQSNGILVDFDLKIQRGFIVLRNPFKSIPSFFNHIYEMRNHLPVHSERAPIEEWTKWRNAYLDIEIAEYQKFIYYWMDRFPPEKRLVITYEGLTDGLIGPEVTKVLNEFLAQASGVTTIDESSVACVWRAVVKNEPPPQQAAQIAKLQSMALNQPQGTTVVQPGAASLNPGDEQQQQEQFEQPSLNNANILEQTLQEGAALDQQQQLPQQGAALGQVLQPQAGADAQQQLLMMQQHQMMQQQTQAQNIEEAPMDPRSHIQPNLQALEAQQQQPSLQALEAQQQQLQLQILQSQQQQQQQQSPPGLRRRLDPGHHNSQRAGPQVPRPYTPKQLEKMMNMLLEVATKYQNEDVRIYHIMMDYYEQIRGERAKLSSDPLKTAPPGGFF